MNTRKPDPRTIAVLHDVCMTEAPLVDVRWWPLLGAWIGECSGCHSTIEVPRHWARRPFVVARSAA